MLAGAETGAVAVAAVGIKMRKILCFFGKHNFKFLGHTEGEWNDSTTVITMHSICKCCMHIKTEEYSMWQIQHTRYEPWFWKELTQEDIDKYKETLHA